MRIEQVRRCFSPYHRNEKRRRLKNSAIVIATTSAANDSRSRMRVMVTELSQPGIRESRVF